MKRIGVDVGGTFTDLILVDEETGRITVDKVPSTPDDPARGVVEGIHGLCETAGVSLSEVDQPAARHHGGHEHRRSPTPAPRWA